MKKLMRLLIVSLVVTLAFNLLTLAPAHAAVSPLSVGLIPPVQFPPGEFSVAGARISALWGKHRDLYGLDLGVLGNITENTFTGIAVSGIFNVTKGMTNAIGAQIAGVVNANTGKASIYGLQAALGLNINTAESKVVGLEIAALGNIAAFTNIYGAQIGFYNSAQDVYGFQIGVVNRCSNLHGLQIGLVNFNEKGMFYVSPILNVGF